MAKIQIKSEKLTPFWRKIWITCKSVWLCTNSSAPKRKNFQHGLRAELLVIKGCCDIGMTEQHTYSLVVAVAFNAACGRFQTFLLFFLRGFLLYFKQCSFIDLLQLIACHPQRSSYATQRPFYHRRIFVLAKKNTNTWIISLTSKQLVSCRNVKVRLMLPSNTLQR